MFKLKDTRGDESHTLGFAVVTWVVGTSAFLYKLATEHPYALDSYGIFVATAVSPFVIREYIKRNKTSRRSNEDG